MKTVDDVVKGDLCHGCGACSFICPTNAIQMENIYEHGFRPLVKENLCNKCMKCLDVCSGISLEKNYQSDSKYCSRSTQEGWGPFTDVLEAWSNDDDEHFVGSSGGLCTAIGRYSIENGLAKGVLHIRPDPEAPLENRAVVSKSSIEVQAGAGSRYAPASLCTGLSELIGFAKPVIVVGKPCEIAAIEKVRRINSEIDKNIALTVSIFCGGTPSSKATEILLAELGVTPKEVTDLRYRGHGWPGNFSVATMGNTERCEMSYQRAWDTVLTKHKGFRCNMCPDSTGESADISVGDAWNRETGNDFAGASLVLTRTDKGREFIDQMIRAGRLTASQATEEDLHNAQKGLLNRHRHVFVKVFWLRVLGMTAPSFRGYPLFRNYLRLGLSRCLVSFWRTGRWFASLKIRAK